MKFTTLINAQLKRMLPIEQPVTKPLPIPTCVPPKNAVITCEVGLGSSFASSDIEAENQSPITNHTTTKTNQTTIFLLFGFGGGICCCTLICAESCD